MDVTYYIDNYIFNYKNYKSYWNYEDGCVLMGCLQLYLATGNEKYYVFVINYVNNFIDEDGTINNYKLDSLSLDNINTGKVLFFIYKKTKIEKYKKAIIFLMGQLKRCPRTNCGNFWHKKIYPNQIWLDGLYMAQPFYMQYETIFNNKENYNDIILQFDNVRRFMYNDKKCLYYHGYDEAKIQPWADKITGLSHNFWLRSMGWYLMAEIDVIDSMSIEIFEQYKKLCDNFKKDIKGILKYQDKTSKLFYQIIDRSDVKDNYTETSGSAMIAYSIMKGCRLGVLSKEKYASVGIEIMESLILNKLVEEKGKLVLKDICWVAGLGPGSNRDGSVEYYLSEEIVSNDSKGVGPFMMAYAQMLMLKSQL